MEIKNIYIHIDIHIYMQSEGSGCGGRVEEIRNGWKQTRAEGGG